MARIHPLDHGYYRAACAFWRFTGSALCSGAEPAFSVLAGAAAITVVEFAVGCVVNLAAGVECVGYSGLRFHLFGQVSLLYSVMWFFLCIPLVPFCNFLRQYLT